MSNPVPAQSTKEALCVVRGSINIDEFFHVPNIVHPGQTLSSTKYERRAGGKGANQAVAIAKAGQRASMCGAAGLDGAWMVDDLRDVGVLTEHLVQGEGPTGRAIIQLSPEGENSIVLLGGANTAPASQSICDKYLKDSPHTHLLVQNEIPWDSTLHALKESHLRDAITFLNPSPMPSSNQLQTLPWEFVDWLIVNEGEAETLFHVLTIDKKDSSAVVHVSPPTSWPSNTTLTRAYSLLHSLRTHSAFRGSVNLVCTLGSLGVVVLPVVTASSFASVEPIYVPAATLDKPVVDTTGAGDCFTGYLVAGFMKRHNENGKAVPGRKELEEIVKVAVRAAGVCVTRLGASESIPTWEELSK